MGEIIVAEEKHGTWYYPASTYEEFAASALHILTTRHEQGYWYPKPDEMFPEDEDYEWAQTLPKLIPGFPLDGTKEEKAESIAAYRASLDEITDPTAKQVALKNLKSAINRHNDKKKYEREYEEIDRIVRERDTSEHTWTDSKGEERTRHEPKAWVILDNRSDHEYERVTLETLQEVGEAA